MGIGKFFRGLWREHPTKTAILGPSLAAGAVIGGIVVTGGVAAAPLLIFPAVGGVMGVMFGYINDSHYTGNSERVNGLTLVGDPKDVYAVQHTQKLIDKWTRKQMHTAALPEGLRKKIQRHIGDAVDALSRLRVFSDTYSGQISNTFTFTRDFYDARGRQETQTLAVIDLKPVEIVDAPNPITLHVPVKLVAAPKTPELPSPNTLKVEFGKPSQLQVQVQQMIDMQVTPLQQRIEALEKENANLTAAKPVLKRKEL